MIKKSRSEKGQAIILIVFGVLGILFLTALAIDGSLLFADRRAAQAAADTSAIAGALAKTIGNGSWQNVALARADSNGYPNNGTRSTVTVNSPPQDPGPYQGQAAYVEVIIFSRVNPWFARIVGVNELDNRVTAIARVNPATTTSLFFGHGMVSLMPGCPANSADIPFDIGGSALNTVTGSGIFVNSNCPNNAFRINGTADISTTGGITVAGGCNSQGGDITGTINCNTGNPFAWPPVITWPTPSCPAGTDITVLSDRIVFGPGTYLNKPSNANQLASFPGDFLPNGQAGNKPIYLKTGNYCVTYLETGSQQSMTTDMDDDHYDGANEGVLFYVTGGPRSSDVVSFSAGSSVAIAAKKTGDYAGLLIYLPFRDPPDPASYKVVTSGSNDSRYVGTILAPTSRCTVQGNGGTLSLDSQIICYQVNMTGSGTVNIIYTDANNYDMTTPPSLEIVR